VSRRLRFNAAFVAAAVFLLCWFSPADADTFWHLRTGRLIVETGLPRVDPFSFALAGRPWVAFEWLSQVLFWVWFKVLGAGGLVALKTGLCVGAFVLAFVTVREKPALSATLAAAAAFGARGFFVARPYAFDHLFFAGTLFALWNRDLSRSPGKLMWFFPAATALWANLHGGAAFLGPFALGCALGAERVAGSRVDWKRWGSVWLLSLAAVLLNPYGWGVVEHFWGTLTFPAKDLIYEWRPAGSQFYGIYGIFWVASLLSLPSLWKRRPRAAVWLGFAAVSSAGMLRNIPLLMLAAVPALSEILGAISDRPIFRRLRLSDPVLAVSMPAALLAAFWLHTELVFPHRAFAASVSLKVPLEGAVRFLEREGVEGRGFNEYEAGGALIYRTGPGRKVFLDGRSLEYGPELLRLGFSWYRPESWKELDARWNFDYAVLRSHPSGAYTAAVLDASEAWGLSYWDDEAMVYLKRNGRNASLLSRREYALLQPGRSNHQYIGAILASPRARKRLLAELDHSLIDAPSCANALQLKTFILVQTDRIASALETARKAVEVHPEQSQAHFLEAWVLEASGDAQGAESAYREALSRVGRRARPTLGADILNNLGRLRETVGDRDGALRLYRRSVAWNPRQGHALRNIARLDR